mmetsp:Transcript_49079/g.110395  ORF Transcript_49079/g.110395 Transcript_49079/m.110395 type:complete len:306 (-) Transcript_49079:46-963(-)
MPSSTLPGWPLIIGILHQNVALPRPDFVALVHGQDALPRRVVALVRDEGSDAPALGLPRHEEDVCHPAVVGEHVVNGIRRDVLGQVRHVELVPRCALLALALALHGRWPAPGVAAARAVVATVVEGHAGVSAVKAVIAVIAAAVETLGAAVEAVVAAVVAAIVHRGGSPVEAVIPLAATLAAALAAALAVVLPVFTTIAPVVHGGTAVAAATATIPRLGRVDGDGLQCILAELVDFMQNLDGSVRSLPRLIDNKGRLHAARPLLVMDAHVGDITVGLEDVLQLLLGDVCGEAAREELNALVAHGA